MPAVAVLRHLLERCDVMQQMHVRADARIQYESHIMSLLKTNLQPPNALPGHGVTRKVVCKSFIS